LTSLHARYRTSAQRGFTSEASPANTEASLQAGKATVLLKTHPKYSAKRLADTIGITEKGVEKQLAKLKAEGLLKRVGPDKGGEWIVL
jgi:ATP-dependent DNA helicase RecG